MFDFVVKGGKQQIGFELYHEIKFVLRWKKKILDNKKLAIYVKLKTSATVSEIYYSKLFIRMVFLKLLVHQGHRVRFNDLTFIFHNSTQSFQII